MIIVVLYCYMVDDWESRLSKQLKRVKDSLLYDELNEFHLVVTDVKQNQKNIIDRMLLEYPKIILDYNTINEYESRALSKIDNIARTYNDCKILYFHTKGVSNKYKNLNTNEYYDLKVKGIKCWTELLEYFIIDHWKECVNKLDEYDTVGVNNVGNWWWGNFWWSNLSWPKSNEKPKSGDRWSFEAWLNNNRFPSYHECFHFEFNPYYTVLPYDIMNKDLYRDAKIEVISAFYGILGEQQDEAKPLMDRTVIDVTEQLKQNLISNNYKGFDLHVDNGIGGDPYFGIVKALEVNFLLNDIECVIVVDENRNLKFSI